MNVYDAVVKRRSIRSYLDKPVSEADVAKIVEAARWAPNAGPYSISVIQNKDLMARVSEKTLAAMLASGDDFVMGRASLPGYQPFHGAPVGVIFSGPENSPMSPLNCAVAAENMILQATELGLGTCFVRSLTYCLNDPAHADLAREAGIPEGHVMQCGVVFGHIDDEMRFRRMDIVPRGEVSFIS